MLQKSIVFLRRESLMKNLVKRLMKIFILNRMFILISYSHSALGRDKTLQSWRTKTHATKIEVSSQMQGLELRPFAMDSSSKLTMLVIVRSAV